MNFNHIITQIKSAIHSGAGANLTIGSPSKVGELSIIPVARISFAFGGGGGKSPNAKKQKQHDEASEDKQSNFGGGGGGNVKTDPVGIYILNKDKVKFYPILATKEIIALFSIVTILLLKLYKLKRKR